VRRKIGSKWILNSLEPACQKWLHTKLALDVKIVLEKRDYLHQDVEEEIEEDPMKSQEYESGSKLN